MRKRTPAISFAIAWNAPPSTRSVIGSTSTRARVGWPRLATDLVLDDAHQALTSMPSAIALRLGRRADLDDDVPEAVDVRRDSGRDDRRRVVLVDDRGALDAVARLQRRRGRSSGSRPSRSAPSTRNHALPSCRSAAFGRLAAGLDLGRRERAASARCRGRGRSGSRCPTPRSGASTRARGCRGSRSGPSRPRRRRSSPAGASTRSS